MKRRVARGVYGLIDIDAITLWNLRNYRAREIYYIQPFESKLQIERMREAELNDPPVSDVDPRDPVRPYAPRLLNGSVKRKIRDGTELYDGNKHDLSVQALSRRGGQPEQHQSDPGSIAQ